MIPYKPLADTYIANGVAVQLVLVDSIKCIRINSLEFPVFITMEQFDKLKEDEWAYDSSASLERKSKPCA